MSSVTFHIELRVQNVETDEHVEAIGMSLERAASLLSNDAILILGDSCTPQLEAYGESLKAGRFEIALRKPDDGMEG
jgi:hypothetical protein